MKQGLLKRHFRLPVLVLIALAAVLPTHLFAETGTTIVFDKSSSHGLYSNGASNSDKDKQWFAFLRHDIAHVQIIASNLTTLSDNGTGSFKQNANDLLFSDNLVKVSNWAGHYGGIYLAVVAPKGYRFTKYEWNIDGSTASEKMSGAYMQQYTYNGTSTSVVNKYSLTNSSYGETFTGTLANGSNVLYFYLNTGQADGTSSSTKSFLFKSIKFTYVIDTPFEGALPATDLSNNVHTGLLDLGTFTNNGKGVGYNSFDEYRAATDTQEAKFYSESDGSQTTIDPTAVTVDNAQYYVTATNDTYYVEAPAKFRIIGATLNFLKSYATRTTYSYTDASSISSGNTYLITDGNGHYLNNDNGAISTGSDPNTATLWTISSSRNIYTIKNGNYYLTKGLALSTSSSSWSYNSSKGFYYTTSSSGSSTTNYLTYSASWTTSTSSGNIKLQTRSSSSTSYTGGDFTASVYGTDGNTATQTVSVSDEATLQSVTLSGLNNDAVKFSISNLTNGANALYNVTLKLLPLNPELQNLSVATKLDDDEVTGASSYTPENYTFNGGDGVTVVVPSSEKDSDHTLVFQDAYNENRTQWYTKGTNTSAGTADYSNYFLVNSTADNGGASDVALNVNSTSYPTDRTTATQAGTAKLVATNIAEVDGGTATTLQDKAFSKTDASYKNATVTPDATTASTYYIYTADVPTYTLLTSGTKHIDYRYYTLVVSCKSVSEEPTATVLPIYTSTLKGRNHKNTGILADSEKDDNDIKADAKTAFYGVKVTIQNQQFGYLTSKQVVDAVKAAVKQQYGEECDSLRGMLYLDMSSLKSVDYDQFDADFHNSTADNCLYFMYPGFHRANITNAIAKVSAKSNKFKAVSDIKIYDQQPFFTPYDFTTDTYSAIYEREGTANNDGEAKDKVAKMAVVLPFDVQLDDYGHMKTASDQTDNDITYYNLTDTGKVDHVSTEGDHAEITFGFTKTAVTTGKAEANKPYYVESSSEKGFSYKVLSASFAASGTEATDKHDPSALTNEMGKMFTATGTYAGEVISKDNSKWYFAKDLFWKSGALSKYKKFNVRPFRAYFTLSDNTTEAKAIAVDASELTGISEVTANSLLDITANHGTITLKAQADTRFAVYTVAGQVVAAGQIAAGETRTVNVQQGVYIVNDKKTVVK